jgi:hypothetical protein
MLAAICFVASVRASVMYIKVHSLAVRGRSSHLIHHPQTRVQEGVRFGGGTMAQA